MRISSYIKTRQNNFTKRDWVRREKEDINSQRDEVKNKPSQLKNIPKIKTHSRT